MEVFYEIQFSSGRISKVNVVKTTDKNVWVERGWKYVRQERLLDAYTGFYRTFHEAQKAGKDKLQKDVDNLNEQLVKKTARLTSLTNVEEEFLPDPPVFEKIDLTKIKV